MSEDTSCCVWCDQMNQGQMGGEGDSLPSGELDHQASNQYSQKNIRQKLLQMRTIRGCQMQRAGTSILPAGCCCCDTLTQSILGGVTDSASSISNLTGRAFV